MQNFPQLVIKFIFKNIRTAGLEIPWLRVQILAGRALKERQCTLKGQAWYVNVRAVYIGRECIEILDQVHKFPHMGKFMHLIQKLSLQLKVRFVGAFVISILTYEWES